MLEYLETEKKKKYYLYQHCLKKDYLDKRNISFLLLSVLLEEK